MKKTIIDNKPLSVQDAFKDLLNEMYIGNVRNRLRQLNEPTENDSKRWIWELIQNAKDSIVGDNSRTSVDIELIVRDSKVQFRHNGSPFTAKAMLGLLYKYSEGKSEDTESTGRFGTGFLTTHVLSKIVSIEGDLYKDEESQELCGFSVTMYRDGINDKELLEGVTRMDKETIYTEEVNEWTTFTYHLKTEKNEQALALGLENFLANIAQTMLFCEEINSVLLDNNGEVTKVTRGSKELVGDDLYLSSFSIDGDERRTRQFIHTSVKKHNEELTHRFKADRNIRMTAAIEVDEAKNIIENIDSPSHFCVLPLVGSEKHVMPIYLNSPDFEPDSERESLMLQGSHMLSDKGVISESGINRLILSESIHLYEKIVAYLSEQKYQKLYLLIKGLKSVPKFEKNFNKEWFKEEMIGSYRDVVKRYEVVETSVGNQRLFDSDGDALVVIPKESKQSQQDEIYQLTSELFPDRVPLEYCYNEWADLAWRGCGLFTSEDLCSYIDSKGSLDSLEIHSADSLEWYNRFLGFVKEYDESLLKEYSLIPNRYGQLIKSNVEGFATAVDVTDFEINCLRDLGEDLNPLLLHQQIDVIDAPVKMESKDVARKINERVGAIIDEGHSVRETLEILTPIVQIVPTDEGLYKAEFIYQQKSLYGYVEDLFSDLPLQRITNNNIHNAAWSRYHKWAVDNLIKTVAEYKTVTDLAIDVDSKLHWLNQFIGFVADKVKDGFLDEFAIIPNQKMEFCKRNELAQDMGIPEELKADQAEQFGLLLSKDLLHNQIDSIKIHNEFDMKKVINRVDELFKDNSFEGNLDDLSFAIYLVHLLPSNESSVLFNSQNKLLEITQKYYYSRSSKFEQQNIECGDEGLWQRANKKILDNLMRHIAQKETVEGLKEFLSESGVEYDYDDTIIFLNSYYDYLSFVGASVSGKVVPNQKGVFCSLDDDNLFADHQMPEMLKDILVLVDSENDFRNLLAETALSEVAQPRHSKGIEDIARVIDLKINDLFKNGARYWDDENFKEAVKLLTMDWFPHERGSHDYFAHTYKKKDTIEMNVLWSLEDRQRMQRARKIDPELLDAFIEDAAEIESIKEEKEQLVKEIEELKSKEASVSQNIIDISNQFPDMTIERIMELLSLEERTKEWNTTLTYSPNGAGEEQRNFENGYKGEAYVYKQLLRSGHFADVKWSHKITDPEQADYTIVDFEGETHYVKDDYSKYDLSVETKEGERIFIEVKSTRTNLSDADNIALPISTAEWKYVNQINDSDKYYLARVFNVENNPEEHFLSLVGMEYSKL